MSEYSHQNLQSEERVSRVIMAGGREEKRTSRGQAPVLLVGIRRKARLALVDSELRTGFNTCTRLGQNKHRTSVYVM